MPTLQRCVGDVDDFLNRYWGRAPLLRPAHLGGEVSFDDLASLDDLDHVVASLGLGASSLRMVKEGDALPQQRYTTAPPARRRRAEGRVNPALVYERFYEGATIVLEAVHRYWEPLADFCRELELALGHRLQVNAYVTPPGSQGLAVHRDDHDVFVLQVSGAKHWIVYDRDRQDAVLIDQDLERGACLYIPKGFPHAATTGDTASAHLTVGVLTHDSIEVLRALTKLAEEEPTFQAPLHLTGGADAASLRGQVAAGLDELRMWLEKVDIDELTHQVARRVLSTSQPVVRGQLRQFAQLGAVDSSTIVIRRRGATCVLFTMPSVLKVLLADRELEMPLDAGRAMQEVARRDRFTVGDLHPYLDPEGAVVLVRRLVREGLLEVTVGG